jgi:hypothetical protein
MPLEDIVARTAPSDPDFYWKAAHGAVRRECGWHVAPSLTETIALDGSGGRTLLLPTKRITQILAVTNGGEDVTARVDVSRNTGMIELTSGAWTDRLGQILVTLTHGYEPDEVPEVSALIAALAKRGPVAMVGAGLRAQSVGPASAQYSGDSIPLLQTEKDTLAPYKLTWGV